MDVVNTRCQKAMVDERLASVRTVTKTAVRRFEPGGTRAVGRWTSHDIRMPVRNCCFFTMGGGRIPSDNGIVQGDFKGLGIVSLAPTLSLNRRHK